jgi:hypothetical protein
MARAALGLGVMLAVLFACAQRGEAQASPTPPDGYEALYEQATNELGGGNWSGAQSLFTQAHELYPNAATLRGLGLCALELGQHERAAGLLERALSSSVRPLSPALRAQTEAALARARSAAPGTAAPPPSPLPAPPPSPPPAPPPPAPLPPPDMGMPPPVADPAEPYEPRRSKRDAAVAGSLGVMAVLPFEGYAEETRGMGITAGIWVQLGHLVFEPRIGTLFDVADDARGYFHLPVELGTYALIPFSDHGLFIGPGVGMNALFERVDVAHTVGTAVVASSHDTLRDNAIGFSVFGRFGFVLMRTSTFSLAPSVDYGITFADLVTAENEQALRIQLTMLMGGGGR